MYSKGRAFIKLIEKNKETWLDASTRGPRPLERVNPTKHPKQISLKSSAHPKELKSTESM